ncbi:TM2 domain-containing protein [Saccharicrinis aurantiacus]|uniref:TM2 domain-containing protein n=1 Tax=Saccharicrinis aurantiacus TaxID=1849719 RepID=UPI00094F9C03|nr:TM2 domain-containing protein [Saccharicrinis aurantiacus]
MKIINLLPEVDLEEALFIDNLLKDKDDEQIKSFANVYRVRRKDPQTFLLLALAGFVCFSGIHRFYANQIGMGLLYFFTGGLCFIGTIVDLVNHKTLALEVNQKSAMEVAAYLQ